MEKISEMIHDHYSSSLYDSDLEKSSPSSVKSKIHRLFGRERPVHKVLGGDKPADIFLGRNKKISAGVLGVATAIWVLFELLEYHLLTLVCLCLMVALAILFLWANATVFINKSPPCIPEVHIPEEPVLQFKWRYQIILKAIAQWSPMDGLMLVKELLTTLIEVVVTGDGTNDAPVLHEEDIGVATGIAGTKVAKHRADAVIPGGSFLSIVTGVKRGCSAYMYDIQKFAEFQFKNVLPLIVYFSSACLTENAQVTAVLLLILGGLAKKPMSKRILPFFILMGLVFSLKIQVVEGRGLKAVSDVKGSPSLTSFKEMFSAEKKEDPVLYPPPSAAPPPHY